jgi:adenylate kinase
MAAQAKTTLISLVGKPGSGKGTYGALLASRYRNLTFLSVGDVLRDSAKRNETLRRVLTSGKLVDDNIVNEAVIESLQEENLQQLKAQHSIDSDAKLFNDGGEHVILDGFPRTDAQTKLLSEWPSNLEPALAIYFDVPDDIVITKLLGRRKCTICGGNFNINGVEQDGWDMPPLLPIKNGCKEKCDWDIHWEKRDDDTADIIKERMQVFRQETEPVLESWSNSNRLVTFVPYKGVKEMDRLAGVLENYFHKHSLT